MRLLRDTEIQALLQEPKMLPKNWQSLFQLKEKSNFQHAEREFEITGQNGGKFRVILRQNKINVFDFSIILMFEDEDRQEYRLLRYNGKHPSEHTNNWEKHHGHPDCKFSPAFHIHRATERYQEDGYAIDGYAEVTHDYYDFKSALDCFLKDNNFQMPQEPQGTLFGGELL